MKFKAFINVVKSMDTNEGFSARNIIKEPCIDALDKTEVKKILLERYPQFFQNGKVYEKETKDSAQFFYVLIFPLTQYEIKQIEEGEWTCSECGQVYENKYVSRPLLRSNVFGSEKMFCGDHESPCLEKYTKRFFQNKELADDFYYVRQSSPNYIYKITEKSSGKCYIGKTKNAPFFRWWNHLTKSNAPFGLYLRETKLSDWTFEVLEELPCDVKETYVFEIESKYILKFDSINNGFNSLISNKNA